MGLGFNFFLRHAAMFSENACLSRRCLKSAVQCPVYFASLLGAQNAAVRLSVGVVIYGGRIAG